MMKLQFKSDQQAVVERFSNVFNGGELNGSLLVRKNQTTDKAVTYSRVLSNYVENSGFPDFVEIV